MVEFTQPLTKKQQSPEELRMVALHQLESLGRVTVPNAALLWGIHPNTVRNYIARKRIDAFKLGSWSWIPKDEITRISRLVQNFHESGQKQGTELIPEPQPFSEDN